VRSCRALCDFDRKSEKSKISIIRSYLAEIDHNMPQFTVFGGFLDFWNESFIWDLNKFFQRLRFVCNRAYVRSCRALCDFDRKSEKSKISIIRSYLAKIYHNMLQFMVFGGFRFLVWELHLRSQEIFSKSQICLQPSSCEIPQSTLWFWQKIENPKISIMCLYLS